MAVSTEKEEQEKRDSINEREAEKKVKIQRNTDDGSFGWDGLLRLGGVDQQKRQLIDMLDIFQKKRKRPFFVGRVKK